MAVRYDTKFLAEINKVIKAYNRKITRLSKSDNDYQLPQKFSNEALKCVNCTDKLCTQYCQKLRKTKK